MHSSSQGLQVIVLVSPISLDTLKNIWSLSLFLFPNLPLSLIGLQSHFLSSVRLLTFSQAPRSGTQKSLLFLFHSAQKLSLLWSSEELMVSTFLFILLYWQIFDTVADVLWPHLSVFKTAFLCTSYFEQWVSLISLHQSFDGITFTFYLNSTPIHHFRFLGSDVFVSLDKDDFQFQ